MFRLKFITLVLFTVIATSWSFGTSAMMQSSSQTSIVDVEWHPDGIRLAQVYGDGSVEIVDTSNNQAIFTFTPTIAVQIGAGQVGWSADGMLLAAGIERYVYVWNVTTSQLLHTFVAGADDGIARTEFGGDQVEQITSLDWSPDDSRLAVRSFSPFLSVWNVTTGQQILKEQFGNQPTPYLWTLDGNQITNGSTIIDPTTTPFEFSFITPGQNSGTSGIVSADRANNGSHIVYGGVFGEIAIRDMSTGNIIAAYDFDQSPVMDIKWSPDDTLIASLSSDNVVRVWDATSGNIIDTFQPNADLNAISWHPGGQTLTYAGSNPDGSAFVQTSPVSPLYEAAIGGLNPSLWLRIDEAHRRCGNK